MEAVLRLIGRSETLFIEIDGSETLERVFANAKSKERIACKINGYETYVRFDAIASIAILPNQE